MYDFKDYTQAVNAAHSTDAGDTGFVADAGTKMVAINFDDVDLSSQMTVVCSGAARGGSSILPYLLQNLGLPMGQFEANNYEDIEMLRNRQSVDALAGIIEKRNAQDRWGFKIPSLRRGQFKYLEEALRNPVFVYILRNPLMTAQSVITRAAHENYTENRKGFANALEGCLQSYLEFATFMRQTPCPCILLPMEALKTAPRDCVAALDARLGLGADDETIDRLAGEVSVSGYKQRPR